MTDNELLVLIQADVRSIHDRIMEEYSAVALPAGDVVLDGDNFVDVTATLTVIREALATSQKVVVTNMGDGDFNLFEGGVFVGRLFRFDTWDSPLNGSLEISAQCDAGDTSKAAVATYTQPE